MLSNSKLNVTATLDTLLNASKNWEQNSRKTSNDTLYAILADCLRFYEDLLADVKARKELNAALLEAKITFTEATDLATKIARYVFRTEAKRTYVYARVLKIALNQKISPNDFAKWVSAHDGIDAISKQPKNGVSAAKQKSANTEFAANELSNATPAASLQLPTTYAPNAGATHVFSAAILRHERNGSVSIVYSVNNGAIVKTMLALAGRTLRQSADNQKKSAVEQQNVATRESIITEAAASAHAEMPRVAA